MEFDRLAVQSSQSHMVEGCTKRYHQATKGSFRRTLLCEFIPMGGLIRCDRRVSISPGRQQQQVTTAHCK
jgi:hypothetical protein